MKKFGLLVMVLILGTTIFLTGCGGSKGLKDNPEVNAPVISNGGLSVRKGDYLYYVNGFKSYNELTKDKDNVWGKQQIGALYRVKISGDNSISKDKDGFLTKSEVVVPKLIGTENASFYIFGNYIYYATPNMQKDSKGNLLNERSNMCKIKINGTDNKVLYTTDTTLTSNNWTMVFLDDGVYMIINDNNKIISIDASSSKPQTKVMVKDVTSCALIRNDKTLSTDDDFSSNTIDGYNNYVYYTRNVTEDDELKSLNGNVLARVKIGTTKEEIFISKNNFSYNIIETKNSSLYYYRTNITTSNAILCKYELNSSAGFNENNEQQISHASYNSVHILNANSTLYIGNRLIAINSSNQILLIQDGLPKTIYTGDSELSSIGLYGSLLFFLQDSLICYIDVTATNPVVKVVETNGKSIKTSDNFFDFDGRNVYFYASYKADSAKNSGADQLENYYLNRTDIYATEPKSEFIGVFAKGHTPAQPSEDDEDAVWIE